MNRLKQITMIITRALMIINKPETKEKAGDFVENIRENVKIALDIGMEILEVFEMDTNFRNRGIDNALIREITEELAAELNAD